MIPYVSKYGSIIPMAREMAGFDIVIPLSSLYWMDIPLYRVVALVQRFKSLYIAIYARSYNVTVVHFDPI